MEPNLEQSFIKQFAEEVKLAYQTKGAKLRTTVRSRGDVKGSSVVFQRIGKGGASTKSRHGMIPVMNLDHTPVECALQDFYAGDWVDQLDQFKMAHDERQVAAESGAHALGRKTDELIIQALDQSAVFAGVDTDGLTKAKALAAFETLGDSDVPDDGQRYAIVGWKQWSELLQIEEFANSDYVGKDDLPWHGTQGKRWLGGLWMPHSGLTKSAGDVRFCHFYHKSAVGHGAGAEVKTDITWHGDRASWFVANMMSQGAALVDPEGVVTMRCLES